MFASVLIQRETISICSNFKLLTIINRKKKIKCFACDCIDNRRSLKLGVQTFSLLKNVCENVNYLFLMKAQITR